MDPTERDEIFGWYNFYGFPSVGILKAENTCNIELNFTVVILIISKYVFYVLYANIAVLLGVMGA